MTEERLQGRSNRCYKQNVITSSRAGSPDCVTVIIAPVGSATVVEMPFGSTATDPPNSGGDTTADDEAPVPGVRTPGITTADIVKAGICLPASAFEFC